MTPSPKVLGADELHVGLAAEYERDITESDVLEFAANSGDFNPLHVDSVFAQQSRYAARIVHGAFQVGLASALIGMQLPGRDVLLGSVNARFLSPLFFPRRVRVSGEVTAWNIAARAGSLRVTIIDLASHVPVSEITMAFTLQDDNAEGQSRQASPQPAQVEASFSADRKIVVLTGASGGVGCALLKPLTEEFSVIAITHRHPLKEKLPHLVEVQADISAAGWENAVGERMAGKPLYGIVHCAWAGMPKGGLLHSDPRIIEEQLACGTSQVVRLARFLFDHVGADGGRIVALGSAAGHHKPALALGAYSLAKSALEDTLRLLAPELARRKICINGVCPTFMAAGMNAHADDFQIKREKAFVPLGRVCETQDIVGTVQYLLSPAASFLSGQSIQLSGAQL